MGDDSFTSSLESDDDGWEESKSGSSNDLNEIKEESDEDSFGEDQSVDEHLGVDNENDKYGINDSF